MPWTRLLLAVAVVGPALWIGGVPGWVVPALACAVACLLGRQGWRARPFTYPRWAWLGLGLAGWTALACVPLPHAIREALAPGLTRVLSDAMVGASVDAWPSLSPAPADGLLEVARLLALTGLFVAASRVSWRTTAVTVVFAGSLIAFIGFIQEAFGAHRILGIYAPVQVELWKLPSLMTTFVNPNNQASLFLLTLASAGAVAIDEYRALESAPDLDEVKRRSDRLVAALGAGGLALAALVLSLSRGGLLCGLGSLVVIGLITRRHGLGRMRTPAAKKLLRWVVAVYALIFVAFAVQGAFRELGTLLTPDQRMENKLVLAWDSLGLVSLSPYVGIGRGAFADLLPQLGIEEAARPFTHLETVPVTMVLEWGPVVGSCVVLAFVAWSAQTWRAAGKRKDALPRRVLLVGLVAVAVHNLVDFNLEFCGVTAPWIAIAGGLSGGRTATVRRSVGLAVAGSLALLAMALGLAFAPHSWSATTSRTVAPEYLRWRPIDSDLHHRLARQAADAGDWPTALARARAATRLRPSDPMPWALRSVAEDALEVPGSDESMRRALDRLVGGPSPAFSAWLAQRYAADQMQHIVPPGDQPAAAVAWALLDDAPDHAAAAARTRLRVNRDDPEALALLSTWAFRNANGPLALHYARLLRAREPERARAHLLVANAYRIQRPARHDEAIATLLEGRQQVQDGRQLAEIEAVLIRLLVARAGPGDFETAREVGASLVRRPGSRQARVGRERLIRTIPGP